MVNIYLSLTSPAEQGRLGVAIPTACSQSSAWFCLYLAMYSIITMIINVGGVFTVTLAWDSH